MRSDDLRQLALELFSRGDVDLSSSLSFDEGYTLLRKIGVTLSEKEIHKKFTSFDINHDNQLQREEFVRVARDLL